MHVKSNVACRQWLNLLTAILLLVYFEDCQAAQSCSSSDKLVVCYYESWAFYRPSPGRFTINDIDPSLCTHLMYAFATLNDSTYEIQSHDPYLDIQLGGFQDFTNLKLDNPGLLTMLSVGGWTDSQDGKYGLMVADKVKRTTFIESAVKLLNLYNFDGLDVDWEYPTDKQNFALFVTELRTAFDVHGLKLSIAMGAGEAKMESAYDFDVLCQKLDFINFMTYDLAGHWDGVVGHHTALGKLRSARKSAKKLGACIGKMVVGMAAYGRTFELADPQNTAPGAPSVGPGLPGPLTREAGYLGYNEVCDNSYAEYTRTYDRKAKSFSAVNGVQWVSYDDIKGIKAKSQWVQQNGFLGAMVWAIGTDDFTGNCGHGKFPLLRTINAKMAEH